MKNVYVGLKTVGLKKTCKLFPDYNQNVKNVIYQTIVSHFVCPIAPDE